MRTLAALTVLVLLGVAATSQDHPTREIGTGLALVGPNYQQKPPGEALAGAWSEAWDFAQRNPDALGFPWMDPRTNELVARGRESRGRRAGTSVGAPPR